LSPDRTAFRLQAWLVLSIQDSLALDILPASGRPDVEVDGQVAAQVAPGGLGGTRPRPVAAPVVRLGRITFYERSAASSRLTDSAEVPAGWAHHQH
jgi:NAD+ kinase